MRWINIVFVLALNAVPLYGALVLGWSISTLLVLYWFENLLLVATTSARIVLHRRWSRKRGHWMADDGSIVNANCFLLRYLPFALVFTVAQGIFVAAIAFGMQHNHRGQAIWQFSPAQFRDGALSLTLLLVAKLSGDLPGLSRRSFAWLRGQVDGQLVRVSVLHVVIILGLWAIALTASPLALLGVLIAAKALVEVRSALSTGHAREPVPAGDSPGPAAGAGHASGISGRDAGASYKTRLRKDAQPSADRVVCEEEVMPASLASAA